jgi:hypothetical protein
MPGIIFNSDVDAANMHCDVDDVPADGLIQFAPEHLTKKTLGA